MYFQLIGLPNVSTQ